MFTKLKTTTLAVVTAAATLLGSGQAWALDAYNNFNIFPVGPCSFNLFGNTGPNGSSIFLRALTSPQGYVSPTLQQEALDDYSGTSNNFTPSTLATCGFTDATNIVIDGVSLPWQNDDYYGVRWRATDPADGVLKDWEVAWSGASGSALINTAIPVPTDTTSPSVTLSSTTTTLTGTDPFTVTATFDEDVTGFDDLVNDVTITNGSVTGITGGPSVYTLTVTPTGAGDVEITVPAAAAQDAAANDNTASNTLVIGNRIVEITQEHIAGFMLGRANNLASNQPGLTRFLMGDGCGNFNANATNGSGSINGCVSQGNTWAEISGAWSGDDSYVLGSFGAHSFVNPNLLIGGMLQFDRAEDSANNASGTGWMVGPYFVAQVPDQPLFFEGRLLYGQTDNDISPLGTYTDSFETERWLAQLRATGEYQYQNTTLMPLLDVTYTDDTQQAYTDSLGNTIPGQTVSLMQVTAGLDFSHPLPVQTGALELTGGLSAIYSSTDGAAASPEFESWRGRTHLGLNYDTGAGGPTMNVGAFYDGIGTNYESYGANLGLDWKF